MGFFKIYIDMLASMTTPEIYEAFPLSKIVFFAIAAISAVVILALFIATAALSKKQRVIGVLAGLANFVSALTIPTFVKTWHFVFTPIASLDSISSIEQAYVILGQSIRNLVVVLIATAIMMVAFALTIVFIAKSFKNKPAIFSLGALALVILRQLWIAPFPMLIPMILKVFVRISPFSPIFYYGQIFQMCAYFAVMVVAVVLVLVPIILNKVKAPASVEEAPADAE